LYEDAVNNVLKIKAFPDDTETKRNEKNEKTRKQIETEFKRYLETPMEIEKKIDAGIFKYSKKRRSSPVDSKPNTPENKKLKLIDAEQLDLYLKGDSGSSNSSTPVLQTQTRINPTNENMPPLLIRTPESQQNFFSKYLTDPSKIPTPFKAQSYISPMDYPWFYPSYFYESFYAQNHPPPHIPPPPPPPPPPQSSNPPSIRSPIRSTLLESKNESKSPAIQNKDLKTHTMNTRSSSTNKTDKNTKKYQNDNNNKIKLLASKPNNSSKQSHKSVNRVESPIKDKTKIKKESLILKKVPPTLVKDAPSPPTHQNMLKNSKRKPPQTLSQTDKKPQITSSEKRLRNKEKLKFRYSLRQRTKALKKAKKLAKLQAQNAPKYILKKLDKRTSTMKELFLATFGLRRILKRIDNPPPPSPHIKKEE